MSKKVAIEVIAGVEGSCVCIAGDDGCGFRLAGPKPWGGGRVVQRFKVDLKELIYQAKKHSFNESPRKSVRNDDDR